MSHCLICSITLRDNLKFIDLLLLQRSYENICQECSATFIKISDTHCPTCYKEGVIESCIDCSYWKKQNKEVTHKSIFRYNQAMKDFFRRYKFQGDYLLRKVFAPVLKKELHNYKDYKVATRMTYNRGQGDETTTLDEKPLRLVLKFKKRGFNQVEGLLEAAKIPYQDLLNKKDSETQSSKNREGRLQNVGNFTIKENSEIPSKILLIDDIYTTGATLQYAKRSLLENGAKEIMTFSLAR